MSNNLYRNAEGYYDPTAGAVLAGISRKEKSDRRKARRRRNARARKQAAALHMESEAHSPDTDRQKITEAENKGDCDGTI